MWSWERVFDYSVVQTELQALAICQPVHGPKKRLCTQSSAKSSAARGASVVIAAGAWLGCTPASGAASQPPFPEALLNPQVGVDPFPSIPSCHVVSCL